MTLPLSASKSDSSPVLQQLQLVFTRLLGAGDWSHVQLVKYLISVRDTLSANETDRLRKTTWLPREGEGKVEGAAGPNGEKGKPKTIRYRASDLYEVSPSNSSTKRFDSDLLPLAIE